MIRYTQRALKDIWENPFLNGVTIATIALSVLIVSAFGLFFVNAQDMFEAWKKGVRIMVYLKPETTESQRQEARRQIEAMTGIAHIRFISKTEALTLLQERVPRQAVLLDRLRENPLPDAFEITLMPASNALEKIEFVAQRIEGLPSVAEVQYGQQWVDRFSYFFNLFKLGGYAMGTLFFMATVFIAANTIRLSLYSRREEIHIMRLVGATDTFISVPFYLEGLLQGLFGSLIGLVLLYAAYFAIGSRFGPTLSAEMISIRFFGPHISAVIIACGMATGLLGSFFSLRQFMKG